MNLKLKFRSTINKQRCCIASYLPGEKLFADYENGFVIYDYDFNIVNSFEIEFPLLITHYYFSKNREYFLWYCDSDSYICFLDLTKPNLKPIKIDLPENLIVGPYYVWDDNKFIIAGRDAFFCYDVKNKTFTLIDNQIVESNYSFFKVLFDCDASFRILFYDFEKEIIVYRSDEVDKINTIYVKHPIKEMNVQFEAPYPYIHTASYLDGVLVLVEDDHFIFYYMDKEFHQIVNNKDIWLFRTAELFKDKNKIYGILFSYYFNGPENTIEMYGITE